MHERLQVDFADYGIARDFLFKSTLIHPEK